MRNIYSLLNKSLLFYRNRQPPPSGLGTASPAYVEARMYAPANATKKQVGKKDFVRFILELAYGNPVVAFKRF